MPVASPHSLLRGIIVRTTFRGIVVVLVVLVVLILVVLVLVLVLVEVVVVATPACVTEKVALPPDQRITIDPERDAVVGLAATE
jgi:hypothetical protein